MLIPAQFDDTRFSQQGFRLILRCGIAVMLLFCIASFSALAQQPAVQLRDVSGNEVHRVRVDRKDGANDLPRELSASWRKRHSVAHDGELSRRLGLSALRVFKPCNV